MYRADYPRGKTLNDDQKSAIAKYDEVRFCLFLHRESFGVGVECKGAQLV